MKKLQSYTDSYYQSKNTVYESNGVQVLVIEKPGIKDFTADVIFRAGAFFESQLGMPAGTAHFVEHMMCNPNRTLRTYTAQKEYEFGNRTTPEITRNAATWYKYVSYFGNCHPKSAKKLLKYLQYQIDYPTERFEEFFDNERNVILAELQSYEKEEKDAHLDFQRFIYGRYQPAFNARIIGTEESIRSITIDMLTKFINTFYTKKYTLIAIQTPKALGSSLINTIESITKLIKEPSTDAIYTIPTQKITNIFNYKAFFNEKAQGVSFVFGYFFPTTRKSNYVESVCKYLVRTLLWFLAQKHLREEKALVYGLSANQNHVIWHNFTQIFQTKVEIDKISDFFEAINHLIFTEAEAFLQSPAGLLWFEGQISRYIFKRTVNVDLDYARNEASNILLEEIDYKYDYATSIETAKKLKVSQLVKFYRDLIINQKPHVWMETSVNTDAVLGMFERSSLYASWKK